MGKLKLRGNDEFKKGKWQKAIEIYKESFVSGQSDLHVALLSNRALMFLKMVAIWIAEPCSWAVRKSSIVGITPSTSLSALPVV